MAKISIFNISSANAMISAANDALAPALEKAGIKTLTENGKVIPAHEASLATRISAFLAVTPTDGGNQDMAELMVTNSTLATQLEKQSLELATANATVGRLQLESTGLVSRAETAEGSVHNLTATVGQLEVQFKAAKSEFNRVNRELGGYNTELSKACIAVGCLELLGENGGPLPQTATEAQKLAAADKMPVADKLKAYQGAINSAISRVGLSVTSIPGSPLKLEQGNPKGIVSQFNAITDPTERTTFYRKNKAAIDAAYRE